MSKKQIGILAGTFDPIHDGHIALAETAKKAAKLDKVILLVERQPRRKQAIATFEQRLKMCQLAAANHKWLEVLELKDLRFDVQQTLPQLQKHFPKTELAMILGSDVFLHLPTWPAIYSLVERIRFIVAVRSGDVREAIEDVALDCGAEFMLVESRFPAVSSSQIRKQLHRGETKGVDVPLLSYIKRNKLYVDESSDKA